MTNQQWQGRVAISSAISPTRGRRLAIYAPSRLQQRGFSPDVRSSHMTRCGQPTSEQQCTKASCGAAVYSPSYSYDLAGNVITHSSGIPSGAGSFVFTNVYNSSGNLSTVTSSNTLFPTSLFTAIQSTSVAAGCNSSPSTSAYSSAGGLQNAIFGLGLQLTRSYDNRMRINCETDFGNSVLNPTPGSAVLTINGTDQTH